MQWTTYEAVEAQGSVADNGTQSGPGAGVCPIGKPSDDRPCCLPNERAEVPSNLRWIP